MLNFPNNKMEDLICENIGSKSFQKFIMYHWYEYLTALLY